MHIELVKTAKTENGDEIYLVLKTDLKQGTDEKHTVEARLIVHHVDPATDELYHEVWVDGGLQNTSERVTDPQRAYIRGRRDWRLAITEVLNNHWPLPEFTE